MNFIPYLLDKGLSVSKSQYNIFWNSQKWNENSDSGKDKDLYCLNDLVENGGAQ